MLNIKTAYSRKRKNLLLFSVAIAYILILIFIFTPICPQIDPRIMRCTEFEIYSVPKRDDTIGISGKEVLLSKSSRLNTKQRKLVYSYIRKIKRIKDDGKPINSYLQSDNDDFVIIKFSNNITLYFEPNSSTYSDENTIDHCKLSHDEDKFNTWFSQLRIDLSEHIGISNSEVVNMAMKYIQYPEKLKRKAELINDVN